MDISVRRLCLYLTNTCRLVILVCMSTWKDGEPRITKQMTLADFDRMFPDETACKLYLTMRRWPTGSQCPRW